MVKELGPEQEMTFMFSQLRTAKFSGNAAAKLMLGNTVDRVVGIVVYRERFCRARRWPTWLPPKPGGHKSIGPGDRVACAFPQFTITAWGWLL
jgi:hypothetical protein